MTTQRSWYYKHLYNAHADDIKRMYVDEKLQVNDIADWLLTVGVGVDVELACHRGRVGAWLTTRGIRRSYSEMRTLMHAQGSYVKTATKTCAHCLRQYVVSKSGFGVLRQRWCTECRGPNGEGTRLLKAYNMSWPEHEAMMLAQHNRCAIAICNADLLELKQLQPRLVHVDHDHVTERVRGIVCHRCNQRLAVLDDQAWVKSATAYLEQHSLSVGRMS
jgi:hypothetical protein